MLLTWLKHEHDRANELLLLAPLILRPRLDDAVASNEEKTLVVRMGVVTQHHPFLRRDQDLTLSHLREVTARTEGCERPSLIGVRICNGKNFHLKLLFRGYIIATSYTNMISTRCQGYLLKKTKDCITAVFCFFNKFTYSTCFTITCT